MIELLIIGIIFGGNMIMNGFLTYKFTKARCDKN